MGLFHRRILQERTNMSTEDSSLTSEIIDVKRTSQYSNSTKIISTDCRAQSDDALSSSRAQKIVLRAVGSLMRKPIRKVPSKSDYKSSLSKISSHPCVISE
ncbi:hypothetical protein J6590_093837 [Homalodisca vitripennis]|nr:hypothetical protein J6590_093837 [Homalodisca vitripennis]